MVTGTKVYCFGPFRLDPAERLLLRDQVQVRLSPKAFAALTVLVENRGHLLEKDELLKQVWPETFVEESNLAQHISLLRKALKDGEEGARYIETVPRRGYRFVAEVREINRSSPQVDLFPAAPAPQPASSAGFGNGVVRRHARCLAVGGMVLLALFMIDARSLWRHQGPATPATIRSLVIPTSLRRKWSASLKAASSSRERGVGD